MRIFKYMEIPFDPQQELCEQLNRLCVKYPGWSYHSMAQKVLMKQVDFRTGQPKIELVFILQTETVIIDDKSQN